MTFDNGYRVDKYYFSVLKYASLDRTETDILFEEIDGELNNSNQNLIKYILKVKILNYK